MTRKRAERERQRNDADRLPKSDEPAALKHPLQRINSDYPPLEYKVIPPFLLRYLPHLIGLVAVVGGLWYFGHTRYNAGQEAVRAEFREALAAQGRTNNRVTKTVLEGYRHEIERIRNHPARVVRLCNAKGGLPATGTAPGVDGSNPGGELSGSPGPDIGSSLYSEAARADALAAQQRALQAWILLNRDGG